MDRVAIAVVTAVAGLLALGCILLGLFQVSYDSKFVGGGNE